MILQEQQHWFPVCENLFCYSSALGSWIWALSIISALADLKTEGNPEPVNLWDPEPCPPPPHPPGPPGPLGIAGEDGEREFYFAFTGLSFLWL